MVCRGVVKFVYIILVAAERYAAKPEEAVHQARLDSYNFGNEAVDRNETGGLMEHALFPTQPNWIQTNYDNFTLDETLA
ncbi:MAG: hypothetical protein GY696_08675 [Gammaproteobacteria bacterium]|nr:hypothetical protein [Gammaproteobacteria bacterium]